ncbi:MAG: DUF1598 domain-containing protein [Planctomycetota bacterium]
MHVLKALVLICFFNIRFMNAIEAQDGAINNFAQPIATTVQLPTFGVSFDAEGLLELKTFQDPTGRLRIEQRELLNARLRGDLGARVENRKLSLVRLEAALRRQIEGRQAPDDEMQHLAGMTRIRAAYCLPDQGDIILTGPAEPWVRDFAGVARGIHSGKPILRLDDLVVALRAYGTEMDRPFVGCTINPTPEGLARFRRFQTNIPRTVRMNERVDVMRRVAAGSSESLGAAKIAVFGISPRTHFARVMIEADYRMKRMAIGVEATPVSITTYAQALRTASHGILERWWLTPAYDTVVTTPDATAMRFSGQGVGLQTEMKRVSESGEITEVAGKPNRAAVAFAQSFTRRYGSLAQAATVYAQLRQLCDLLIVAAHLKRHEWYAKARWRPQLFRDDSQYSVQDLTQPLTAPPVVNAFWKQNRLFVPVGGGVSIEADQAIDLATIDDRQWQTPEPTDHGTSWWWD